MRVPKIVNPGALYLPLARWPWAFAVKVQGLSVREVSQYRLDTKFQRVADYLTEPMTGRLCHHLPVNPQATLVQQDSVFTVFPLDITITYLFELP